MWRLAQQRIIHPQQRGLVDAISKSCLPSTFRASIARSTPSVVTNSIRWHGGPQVSKTAPTVQISFSTPDGTARVVEARAGESLLQTAHRNDLDLEGACEGVCACSTCHLVLQDDDYENLPEPSEDEEDMLDMAFKLTDTSRLGCQIIVTEDMEGMVFSMPAATRNFYVDGHVPVPH